MRSPISVKIPKRSESAFPNKRIFHFDLISGWPPCVWNPIFLFYQIVTLFDSIIVDIVGGRFGPQQQVIAYVLFDKAVSIVAKGKLQTVIEDLDLS